MNRKPTVGYVHRTSSYSTKDYINAINETANKIISTAKNGGGVEEILENSKSKHPISEFGTFVRSVYHEIYKKITEIYGDVSKEKFGRILLPLAAPESYEGISEKEIVAYNREAFEATKGEHQALDAIRQYLIYWDPQEKKLTQINPEEIKSR